jgi:hypothetical protein
MFAAWYWHLIFQVGIHPVIRNLQKPVQTLYINQWGGCTDLLHKTSNLDRYQDLVLLDGRVKPFGFHQAIQLWLPESRPLSVADGRTHTIKLKEHRIKVYPNLGKKTCSSPRPYEFVELDLNPRNTSQGLMNPGSSKAPGMNAAHLVTGSLILEPCPYTWDTQTKVLVSLSMPIMDQQTKVLVSLSSTLCSNPSPILEYIEWLKPHPTSQQLAAGAQEETVLFPMSKSSTAPIFRVWGRLGPVLCVMGIAKCFVFWYRNVLVSWFTSSNEVLIAMLSIFNLRVFYSVVCCVMLMVNIYMFHFNIS